MPLPDSHSGPSPIPPRPDFAAPQRPGSPAPPGGGRPEPLPRRPPGLFAALLDFRFRVFALPMLIRWVYMGCMGVVVMVTLFYMLFFTWVANLTNGWAWGVMGLFCTPFAGLTALIVVRVVCEFILARVSR